MRYALIGCGRISPNHIMAAKNNGLEIVAICDIDSSCMADKMLKFKLGSTVKQYIDFKEMIETEKPELVAICTESGKHAEIALFCIEHGCNCIIEKPIALSIADADSIIAASFLFHAVNGFYQEIEPFVLEICFPIAFYLQNGVGEIEVMIFFVQQII